MKFGIWSPMRTHTSCISNEGFCVGHLVESMLVGTSGGYCCDPGLGPRLRQRQPEAARMGSEDTRVHVPARLANASPVTYLTLSSPLRVRDHVAQGRDAHSPHNFPRRRRGTQSNFNSQKCPPATDFLWSFLSRRLCQYWSVERKWQLKSGK